jgi:hypothetical protein
MNEMDCALLVGPDGTQFLAFFDTTGEIQTELAADWFLEYERRTSPSKITLSFRKDGRWELRGPRDLVRIQKSLKVDPSSLRAVPLSNRDTLTVLRSNKS